MIKYLALLASLLLAVSVPLAAQQSNKDVYTFQRNGYEVTLTKLACKDKVILEMAKEVQLLDGSKPEWYTAMIKPPMDEKTYKMCYVVNPANFNEIYFIIEDGTQGGLEIVEKKEPGV